MAHSYTPGLRVTDYTRLHRERRLPLRGEVLVERGMQVGPDTVVARTQLPGNIQTVNLAAKLAIDPAKAADSLVRPIGTQVSRGEVVASAKSLFGLVTNKAESPVAGTIESVSNVTGQLLLREPPIPVEVNAYVRGTVSGILPGEGVVIETRCAFLQGIFGVGGETFGPIDVAVDDPRVELESRHLRAEHKGRVVVGGSFVTYDTLMRARDLGVAAVVAGGFDDRDLRRLLGKDLGVAITGQEEIGLTLVLTEGFGRVHMAQRAWRLLQGHQGQVASVSGATQIRAGVLRPELLVPLAETDRGAESEAVEGGLEVGSLIRVIREPYFGRIARVVGLPAELQPLETEAHVRVLVAEFSDDGVRAIVPRSNVERIES